MLKKRVVLKNHLHDFLDSPLGQHLGKTIQYGKDHLSMFLNKDVRDIDGVMNELDKFDDELDELLWKINENEYGYENYMNSGKSYFNMLHLYKYLPLPK